MTPLTLKTARLILGPFRPDDAEAMFEYASDPETTRYMAWPRHESPADSEAVVARFIEGYASGADMPVAIRLKANERLIGSTGFNDLGAAWTEVGWILRPDCRGQGLAQEAVQALVDWGCRSLPGSARLKATVHEENLASIKLARRLGFKESGRVERAMPNEGGVSRPKLLFTLEPRACRP